MKRIAGFLSIILVAGSVFAANQVTVNTSLKNVKVFLRGAELYQTASVQLEKGVTDVVLTGLARNIDQSSLNVSATGNAVILSVVQRLDYLKITDKSGAVKALEDSLEILNDRDVLLKNDQSVLYAEYDMILANKTIGGQNVKVNVNDLQNMAAFFKKKLGELKSEMSVNDKKLKKNEKDIERIKKQLDELNSQRNQPVNEVVVTVSAKSKGTVDFAVSYNFADAGWSPFYDIRVDKPGAPIKLTYKANVRQNSGFDWNDADVILSTRNPVQNNTKPDLNTWFIDLLRKPIAFRDQKMGAMQKSLAAVAVAPAAESMADYFDVEEKLLSVEFKPSIKFDIPSDGKTHLISVQENTIDARYEYYAVPKMDDNAFLIAAVTGWNNLNLLPGEASIYFENSFSGKTYINPAEVQDTLMISLGRDKNISVSKEVLKDFTEDKFLSSDIERTFAYDIIVKNNKNTPVELTVEDQIPVSMNEDITIKLVDKTGSVYDPATGKLSWKVSVDPSKSVKKQVVYSVRYPKDQVIPNL